MFPKENSLFSDFKDKDLFQHKRDADSWILQLTSVSQLCSFLSLSDLLSFPFCLIFHMLPQAYSEKQAYSVAWNEHKLKSNLESEQSFPF